MRGLPLPFALYILMAGPGGSHELSVERFCETIATYSLCE
jgi:hypothetical protein